MNTSVGIATITISAALFLECRLLVRGLCFGTVTCIILRLPVAARDCDFTIVVEKRRGVPYRSLERTLRSLVLKKRLTIKFDREARFVHSPVFYVTITLARSLYVILYASASSRIPFLPLSFCKKSLFWSKTLTTSTIWVGGHLSIECSQGCIMWSSLPLMPPTKVCSLSPLTAFSRLF